MANLIVDNVAFSGKDAHVAVEVYNWTVTKTGYFQLAMRFSNAAGNGTYTVWLTRQIAGAGTVIPLVPKATYAAGVGEAAFGFRTLTMFFKLNDKVGFDVLGLAGDTSLAGNIDIVEDDALVPIVAGQNATAIDANGRMDLGAVLGTAQTAGDLAALLATIAGYIDTEIATIGGNVATLLSRIIGTLLAGSHNPQSGDTYAVVNNATYGNAAIHADLTTIGGGAGSVAYSNTIDDGTNPLDNVKVWVTTDALGTNIVASTTTNSSGAFTVHLDPGVTTQYLWCERGGINFTNPKTLTYNGSAFV